MIELSLGLIVIMLVVISLQMGNIAKRIREHEESMREMHWRTHFAYEDEYKQRFYELVFKFFQKKE